MKNYVKIKFKASEQEPKWYWAIKLGDMVYQKCDKGGTATFSKRKKKKGKPVEYKEMLIGQPLEEKQAVMNLKYAELEVVEETNHGNE